MNVLLRHLIDLSPETLIDGIKVLDIFVLVVHVALNKSFLAFNI